MTPQELSQAANRLARLLKANDLRIVCAESCTTGLASAALGEIPGISDHHCGSAVVYRIDTKSHWLDVDPKILEKPGPVSRVVARAMAENVLEKTPEADVAVSVTGHLGPNAPAEQDGLIYIGLAHRGRKTIVRRLFLTTSADENLSPVVLRKRRQIAAAVQTLTMAADMFADH